MFKVPPGDVWAFFHATAEASQVSRHLDKDVLDGPSAWPDSKDPRDRATGPGAWPTLQRSVDVADLIRTALERVRAVFRPRTPGRHRPAASPVAPQSWEHAGAVVRSYVERLGDPPRDADTSAQADPWRDAR